MGQAGSNQVSPKKETVDKAVSKHGKERIDKVCNALGATGGIESMTNWQANYLRQCKPETLDKFIEEAKK